MRPIALVVFLASAALAVIALPQAPVLDKITVGQLQQALAAASGKTDAELAQQLSTFELTERLSTTLLAQLNASAPGEKSRQALLLLADKSVFLDPPAVEILADSTPDPAATREMLVKIVNYVNTTLRQLPNLSAIRETMAFEDRPQEDALEATGVVSYSYLPVHFVGKSGLAVTYRDRKEVVDERATKALKHEGKIGGLVTSGEFGPILSMVLADALKGKITWARWEHGSGGRLAVFHYTVPDEKSNYYVKFCCIVNGYSGTGQPESQLFDERASYHGEIAFDPANGSILRITLQAEMPPKGLVSNAGIAMEYSSVEIGGRSYICPAKSVSVLMAHTAAQQGMQSRTNYQGAAKTFLNDIVYGQYRRFGSEARIVSVDSQTPESPVASILKFVRIAASLFLERLPQPLLQKRPISPAHARPRAVLNHRFELSVRHRLQLNDAFNIHQRRPMHAHEPARVEPFRQIVQGGAVQQFFTPHVQSDIDARRLDPVDVDRTNEPRRSSRLHDQPIEPALCTGRCASHHLHYTLPEFADTALVETSLRARHGSLEALIAEGFQQVVECIRLEGPNRVLIVGCDKDGQRHLRCANRVDHTQSIELRHLHIQEHQVGPFLLNCLNGGFAIRGLCHSFHLRVLRQQIDKALACGSFVVRHQYLNRFRRARVHRRPPHRTSAAAKSQRTRRPLHDCAPQNGCPRWDAIRRCAPA